MVGGGGDQQRAGVPSRRAGRTGIVPGPGGRQHSADREAVCTAGRAGSGFLRRAQPALGLPHFGSGERREHLEAIPMSAPMPLAYTSPIEVTRPNIVELRGSRCRRRAPCRQASRSRPALLRANATAARSSRLVSDNKEVTVRDRTDPPVRMPRERSGNTGYRLSSAQVPMAIQAIPANFSGHPAAAFSLCPLMLQNWAVR